MKSVAIYCAAKLGNQPIYEEKAKQLATYLAQQNIQVIYGGAKIGIMGAVAQTTMQNGGQVIGVMPKFLVDKEIANSDITELIITENMSQRKYKMIELADGFIALPGGFGTLEEIFEVITLAQVEQLNKPIAFYNIDNYYTPLFQFLENCVKTGLLHQKHFDLVIIDADYESLLNRMINHKKQ
ncbi:TIGR00730 family Rossman fold protein [Flavobacterium agricola]|uniref:Cytokinin riboside 5'-monophosphate phosphoribohydrolase n=1 Tax=Flavobacterium agricola TaxID=2870839 RepID=A0ABY6M0U4_9FLAO|nr:TIGR00730 family Rossman fold protein [Flavobacterium agricola]UYW01437.1 TIGR00730 family Rossman fold protein [Flavobacterium agricola]